MDEGNVSSLIGQPVELAAALNDRITELERFLMVGLTERDYGRRCTFWMAILESG